MSRAWVLVAFLTASPAAFAAPRAPTSASLRKTFEASRRSIVEVVGPHRHGPGVIIGAAGQVLTSVDYVGLYDAHVKRGGQTQPARVRAANAGLRFAVVEVKANEQLPSAAVRLDAALLPGMWLVAVEPARKGELHPVLAQIRRGAQQGSPFIELNVSLAAGTPLFDTTGKLVALAVGQSGRRGRKALPVPEVKTELARSEGP